MGTKGLLLVVRSDPESRERFGDRADREREARVRLLEVAGGVLQAIGERLRRLLLAVEVAAHVGDQLLEARPLRGGERGARSELAAQLVQPLREFAVRHRAGES